MKKRKIQLSEETKQLLKEQRATKDLERQKATAAAKEFVKYEQLKEKLNPYANVLIFAFLASLILYKFNIITTAHIHFTVYSFIPPVVGLITFIVFMINGFAEYKTNVYSKGEYIYFMFILVGILVFTCYMYKPLSIAVDYHTNGLQEETVYIEKYGPFGSKQIIYDVTFNGEEYRISGFYKKESDIKEGEYVTITYLKDTKLVID